MRCAFFRERCWYSGFPRDEKNKRENRAPAFQTIGDRASDPQAFLTGSLQ
jgi:hypothetical protein